ncbi:MAG TPA: hypothetical protein VJY39_15770 [Acidisphaera sp.]|nr:hypothetical protein [Acidisphaera sp.]
MQKMIIRRDADGTYSIWDFFFRTAQYNSRLKDVAAARQWIERTYPGTQIVVSDQPERDKASDEPKSK